MDSFKKHSVIKLFLIGLNYHVKYNFDNMNKRII